MLTNDGVRVGHELVEILEVLLGVHPLEVGAHEEHDVVGGEVRFLQTIILSNFYLHASVIDEAVCLRVQVVVLHLRVVLCMYSVSTSKYYATMIGGSSHIWSKQKPDGGL